MEASPRAWRFYTLTGRGGTGLLWLPKRVPPDLPRIVTRARPAKQQACAPATDGGNAGMNGPHHPLERRGASPLQPSGQVLQGAVRFRPSASPTPDPNRPSPREDRSTGRRSLGPAGAVRSARPRAPWPQPTRRSRHRGRPAKCPRPRQRGNGAGAFRESALHEGLLRLRDTHACRGGGHLPGDRATRGIAGPRT